MYADFIYLLIASIVLIGLMIWAIYCEMPCLSAVSGIWAGILIMLTFALGVECASEEYNYAIIKLPDSTVIEGKLDYCFDSNGVVEVVIDGVQYEVSQENCALISKKND